MANAPKNDDAADFSGYFGNPKKDKVDQSPITELKSISRPILTKNTKKLLIALVITAIAFGGVIFYFKKPVPQIQEGYKLIQPPGEPPRLERVK